MLLWVGFGFPPSKSLQITGRGALAGCGCEGIDNDMWKGVFSLSLVALIQSCPC